MKRRYKSQGVKPSRAGLRVYFVMEVGQTIRFAEMLVPWFMLTDDDVLKGIERVLAQQLREKWQGDVPLPLEKWE